MDDPDDLDDPFPYKDNSYVDLFPGPTLLTHIPGWRTVCVKGSDRMLQE